MARQPQRSTANHKKIWFKGRSKHNKNIEWSLKMFKSHLRISIRAAMSLMPLGKILSISFFTWQCRWHRWEKYYQFPFSLGNVADTAGKNTINYLFHLAMSLTPLGKILSISFFTWWCCWHRWEKYYQFPFSLGDVADTAGKNTINFLFHLAMSLILLGKSANKFPCSIRNVANPLGAAFLVWK